MRKLIQHSLSRVLALLFCCITMAVQAQTVKIEGYTATETYEGYPLFVITDSDETITVSSSSGSFDVVVIDDVTVAFNSSSHWSSYTLNISGYLYGNVHKLQLINSRSNKGICYFRYDASEAEFIDDVQYAIIGDNAAVIGSTEDIEIANIHPTFSKEGVEYSVTAILKNAFVNRTRLHAVTIPESVTRIEEAAFKDCINLNTLNFNAENCMSCGSVDFPAFPSKITTLTLGNKVTNIPDCFLYSGSQILNVIIPESVTRIGSNAFRNSTKLTELTIPEAISSIGGSAFYGCNRLSKLNFNARNCSYCGTQSAPAFPSSYIRTLILGDKVTIIPSYFLYPDYDYYNGWVSPSNIRSLTIPNSVTSIGALAFECASLRSVTFGSGLVSIAKDAFDYTFIEKAFWLGNTPPSGYGNVGAKINYVANDQYLNLSNQCKYQFLSSKFTVDGTIYVPVSPSERTCDVVDCGYNSSYNDIVVPDKVVNKGIEMKVNNINDYSFYDNDYIKTLELSNNGVIGAFAFSLCSWLKTASLGTNITSIKNYCCPIKLR